MHSVRREGSHHVLPFFQAAGLEAAATSLKNGWEAEISIAVEAIFPMRYLLLALDKFQETSPHTRVEIIESVLSGTEELIAEKKVDLAISGPSNLPIIGLPLMESEFAPVCAPGHPLAKLGRPATLHDLKKHRQIIVRDSGTDRRYSPGWQKAEKRWTFSNIGSAMAAIKDGFGFSWSPMTIIENEIADGTIAIIETDLATRKKVPIYLFSPDPDGQGPAAKALAGFLVQSIKTG
ncbi:MAG: LysR family transcriptional regulator [Sneathiella sp.]|nr:MAG: LysR family transcriptional regulator [Sneathiella sp.]